MSDVVFKLDENNFLTTLVRSFAFICITTFFIYLYFVPRKIIRKIDEAGWISKDKAKANIGRRHIGNLPPVYPNGWFTLAETDELKPNQIKLIGALGNNFIVIRTRSSTIRIFDSCCNLILLNKEAKSEDLSVCLECPAHRLEFQELSGPPSNQHTSNGEPKIIKEWNSIERNDYICVWYHAEGVLPTWYPEEIEDAKKLTLQSRSEYYVNTHMQEIAENVCDIAHFTSVHSPVAFSGSNLQHSLKWLNIYKNLYYDVDYVQHTEPEKQHTARVNVNHHYILFGNENKKYGYGAIQIDQIGPGLQKLYIKPGLTQLMLLMSQTPVEPLVTRTIIRIYSRSYLFPITKLFMFKEINVNFERDMMIWNSKKFLDKPILSSADKLIAKFRRFYSQFYSEHSPTYQEAKGLAC